MTSLAVLSNSAVVADKEVVSCELGGGAALLDLRSSTYFTINSVGAFVWELIQQPKAVAAICDAVVERYDVAREQCSAEVLALLNQLQEAGLLRISHESPA